jgi:hypothetical protein
MLLILPSLVMAGPASEQPPAPQVHEEMWAIPSSSVPMLAYLIRPIGGGPFPLVVMNHGVSLDANERSYFPVIEFRDAAIWFARHGYVVVAPVRPGYGATAIEIPERGLFGLFSRVWENVRMLSFVTRGLPSRRLTSGSSSTCQLSHLSSAMRSSLSVNRAVVGGRLRLPAKTRNLCGLTLETVNSNVVGVTNSLPLKEFAEVHQSPPAQIFEQRLEGDWEH